MLIKIWDLLISFIFNYKYGIKLNSFSLHSHFIGDIDLFQSELIGKESSLSPVSTSEVISFFQEMRALSSS